ncbi:MAG: hypothetical protein JRJ59_09175 [Deltaproteobacteria bacterium]|nr:hypothetical protein [Deltaproteobacteria bacterium]
MTVRLAAALLVWCLAVWPGLSVANPAPEPSRAEESQDQFTNPFLPQLPVKSLKVRYQLTGRFEGQEVLAVKGTSRVREVKALDTAFDLERPVHLWELTEPERIVRLDLISGQSRVEPNLRGILSRLWTTLNQQEKINLALNLEDLGQALGQEFRIGAASSSQDKVLGMPVVKVALGRGRAWYWTGTDIVIKETRSMVGQAWVKETIDFIKEADIPDEVFNPPVKVSLKVDPGDRAWAESLARQIIGLLRRPLIVREKKPAPEKKPDQPGSYVLPIPWPEPAPPGYRSEKARYQLTPNWQPYPRPPNERPWPPPGLGQDLLFFEAKKIAALLKERLPGFGPKDSRSR